MKKLVLILLFALSSVVCLLSSAHAQFDLNGPMVAAFSKKAAGGGASQPTPNAAWYQFASTGTADTSGSGNTLTLNGSPTVGSVTIGTASVRAITFNGSSQYASAADSSSLHFSGDFSISFWIKVTTTTGGDQMFVSKNNTSDTYDFNTRISSAGHTFFEIYDPTFDDNIGSAASFADNAWHHFVGVKNSSGNLILYMDGTSVASTTSTTGSLVNANGLLMLGAYNDTGVGVDSYLGGSMADVEIYSRALSSAEVTALYGGGNGAR